MAKQKNTLAGLVVSDKQKAHALLKTLQEIDKKDDNVKILDAAFAYKDKHGNISLEQPSDLSGKKAGMGGALISALAGAVILGPVGLVAGGLIGGALSGLYGRMRDTGVDDGFMKQLAQSLDPGGTALFLLYQGRWEASMEAVEGALNQAGAHLVYTNLPPEAEEFARQTLAAAGQAPITELEVVGEIAPPETVEAAPPEPAPEEAAPPETVEAAPPEAAEAAPAATPEAPPAAVVVPAPKAPAKPKAAPKKTTKPKAATKPAAAPPPPKPDDFIQIDGIGPKVDAALHGAGILTYAQLEYTSEAQLRQILYDARIVVPKSMATWQTQAGFAARGDWRGLYKYNEKNKSQ
jgi:uncharacterized membrane protein/predicted flap endonuclease-1-like 5' DNA nuclease